MSILTGTFVLAFSHHSDVVDVMHAISEATAITPAALGLLFRYLLCPVPAGISREALAARYNTTPAVLRRDNAALAEAGYLTQYRRSVGKGWQHLIVVTDTPGKLPPAAEAWALLDASLAAGQAAPAPDAPSIAPQETHGATCGGTQKPQVAPCAEKRPIKRGTFSPLSGEKPSIVGSLAELERLAALPPLAPPEGLAELWLTPADVLGLAAHYPRRCGELALRILAARRLPFHLAPRVMALLLAGHDATQLWRDLAGVETADHPVAAARWRLDRMLLAPPPAQISEPAARRASLPPPVVPRQAGPRDPEVAARGAALARDAMRRRGIPIPPRGAARDRR